MPVLDKETASTRSALRYRPIEADEQPAALDPTTLRTHRVHQPVRTWQDRTAFDKRADVLEEPETGPDTLTPVGQMSQRTTGDETLAPASINNSRPPKRQICPPRTTGKLPCFLQKHPGLAFLFGVVLLVLLYTGFFWGRLGVAHLGNDIKYGGHAPTDTVVAEFPGGISATIYATNVATRKAGPQLLQVVIFTGGAKAPVLTLPLLPSEWGDTTQVIPTLSTITNGAQLVLTGDPKAEHWTCPILETFHILLADQGFQVVRVS